jgi:type VI secretion system protein ImpK
MIATYDQERQQESPPPFEHETNALPPEQALMTLDLADATAMLLPGRLMPHHPKAGLNPLVDVAGYLFSVIGKLKQVDSYHQLNKLQKELVREINTFYDAIKTLGYNAEYTVVCRYVLCATIDDIISNTNWGGQGRWEQHSLLISFNQDIQHQDKFFSIVERAIKEPTHYIDLMELLYLCLSMGYKGFYRATEHSQYQLELITNSLYKHIRAYRGNFSKSLSPAPAKSTKPITKTVVPPSTSPLIVLLTTFCVVMILFIGLSYLMDVISNDAFKNITQLQKPVAQSASEE